MMCDVNFTGSFTSYMRACFHEMNLKKIVSDISGKILSDPTLGAYRLCLSDRYLDYEHVIKVTLCSDNFKKSVYVHISELMRNYNKTLSDMTDELKMYVM